MIEMLERPAIRRRVVPFSVERYHELRDLGIVPVKTELLNGVIVEKMTKSPLHTLLAHRLFDRLAIALPPGYQLRREDPLTLATSEPEPDLASVPGDSETYRDRHPTTAELIVEIAVSSVEVDRAKADLYICLILLIDKEIGVCPDDGDRKRNLPGAGHVRPG